MQINVITLFPDFFESPLRSSLLGKAVQSGILTVNLVNLRDYGLGRHRQVDDVPYGGGHGMVLMVEPVHAAMEQLALAYPQQHRIVLSPRGKTFNQKTARRLAAMETITLLCGHYEGIDERVAEHLSDESISIGDFILSGGEVSALALIDSIARLLPGFMGNPDSIAEESFEKENYIEHPQYTRPADFRGWNVPEVLLSGHHARIEEWRQKESQKAWSKYKSNS